MRQAACQIVASGVLESGHGLLEVDCTPLGQPARAGQFVMASSQNSFRAPLRWPLFFSRGGSNGQIIFPGDADYAPELLALRPGATLDLLGPLGQPFQLRPGVNRLLVLVFCEPVAPAIAVTHWAQRQGSTVSLLLAENAWQSLVELLPPDTECRILSAEDYSTLREALQWADQVFAVAAEDGYVRLAEHIRSVRLRLTEGFASIFVPTDFACGVGACGCCGSSHAHPLCTDGPTLDLRQLL